MPRAGHSTGVRSLAVPILASLLLAAPGVAQQRATIEAILDGPELYIDQAQAQLQQQAQSPQVISTGRSRGQLGFNGGATGRINRHSQMQLGQRCFLLNRGELLISGREGGCTRSSRLSVRGTNYLLAVDGQEETEVSVLEGAVDLELIRNGLVVSDPLKRVLAGQRLRISAAGEVLSLSLLTTADYAQVLQGPLFRDFPTPLADQPQLERHLREHHPSLRGSGAGAAGAEQRLRSMLAEIRGLNADLDRREHPATVAAAGPAGAEPEPLPADPRAARWQREHAATPGPGSCWSQVQAYTSAIARVYRDWQAPRPSRKGRFITRVDFDVGRSSAGTGATAANFLITERSGEEAQDRSAFAEARRKSRELPAPPACVGSSLRLYHRFIVEYF